MTRGNIVGHLNLFFFYPRRVIYAARVRLPATYDTPVRTDRLSSRDDASSRTQCSKQPYGGGERERERSPSLSGER